MLNISSATHVPVRRFNSDCENEVYFLPKADIENDTSKAYGAAHITMDSRLVPAHGVALVDSASNGDLQYRMCDKFWISSSGEEQKAHIQVVNIRTFATGPIQIEKVCWYPKILGPLNEL